VTDPLPGADVPIRDAATVVLLRDAPVVAGAPHAGVRPRGAAMHVWMLTRVTQMAFAAGMSVFPGGRVEDADADLPMSGDIATVARRLDCDERFARALVGAAVRETFEETGVLLAVPVTDLATARADVESGRIAFADLLRTHELGIDVAQLQPWSRWITPAGETRRYDTRFFVGALPEGAEPADVTTESSAAQWLSVGDALEQAQRGERKLLPPTIATLASLLEFPDVDAVLAAARERIIEPVRPNIRISETGDVVAELPDGTSITLPRRMFT
jgi:8-oxo-dGTP pyrophosphatase MutT (NUDIX family)